MKRKVILALGVSLDQYIARKDGGVDWLSMDWEYDWMKFFRTIDVVLMGRKSWDKAIEMSGGKKANPYPGTETYVFSNTLKESGAKDVEIISGNPTEFISGLKKKDGKDIWLSGGGELAKSFLDENLVDEISIGITPHVLGSGLPLFLELKREIPLRLISCETHKHKKEDNAMVELKYEVKR